MKKRVFISIILAIIVIGILLILYPTIEIQTDNKLIAFRYSDDISEFETEVSHNESYFYYAERDISISGVDTKKFLFFYVLIMEYEEGNYCDTEFLLEEEYIEKFLNHATIEYNKDDLDIAQLIEGKTAIVGNTRYTGNDYKKSIDYILDGKHETLFVFYVDDLLVMQVGMPDEGPKFIAYQNEE